jgi:hypothetical protein
MCDTTQEDEELKKKNQDKKQKIHNLFYLLDERNNAIDVIKKMQESESQLIEWQKERERLKSKYAKKNAKGVFYIPDEYAQEYRHAMRGILRKTAGNRAERIDMRFKKNVGRYVISLELKAVRDKDSVKNLESKISCWNKRLESLVQEICTYTRDTFLGSTEWKRENASTQIAKRESEVKQIQASIEKSEKELLTLKPKASISHEKAILLRKEMGYTVESFISYLERLKKRMEKQNECEKLEESLSNHLKDFEKTHQCIGIIEKFSKEVDSNLQEICDAVKDSSRSGLCALFDMCTKRINLFLNEKTHHDLTLIEYFTYLKDKTRPMDINNLEDSIKKLTESIESLSALVPDVKNLRSKLVHFQKLLAEKKRMCK